MVYPKLPKLGTTDKHNKMHRRGKDIPQLAIKYIKLAADFTTAISIDDPKLLQKPGFFLADSTGNYGYCVQFDALCRRWMVRAVHDEQDEAVRTGWLRRSAGCAVEGEEMELRDQARSTITIDQLGLKILLYFYKPPRTASVFSWKPEDRASVQVFECGYEAKLETIDSGDPAVNGICFFNLGKPLLNIVDGLQDIFDLLRFSSRSTLFCDAYYLLHIKENSPTSDGGYFSSSRERIKPAPERPSLKAQDDSPESGRQESGEYDSWLRKQLGSWTLVGTVNDAYKAGTLIRPGSQDARLERSQSSPVLKTEPKKVSIQRHTKNQRRPNLFILGARRSSTDGIPKSLAKNENTIVDQRLKSVKELSYKGDIEASGRLFSWTDTNELERELAQGGEDRPRLTRLTSRDRKSPPSMFHERSPFSTSHYEGSQYASQLSCSPRCTNPIPCVDNRNMASPSPLSPIPTSPQLLKGLPANEIDPDLDGRGMTEEDRWRAKLGPLSHWRKWPPVQISQEYLPKSLQWMDWKVNTSSEGCVNNWMQGTAFSGGSRDGESRLGEFPSTF
ncbi:hypothetical protein EDC01DRAFT_730037 [Geopyxis carbonaria]|nr:hypothetical protein EDC01DRAFT_730037 [Geopyxis carbonaria]